MGHSKVGFAVFTGLLLISVSFVVSTSTTTAAAPSVPSADNNKTTEKPSPGIPPSRSSNVPGNSLTTKVPSHLTSGTNVTQKTSVLSTIHPSNSNNAQTLKSDKSSSTPVPSTASPSSDNSSSTTLKPKVTSVENKTPSTTAKPSNDSALSTLKPSTTPAAPTKQPSSNRPTQKPTGSVLPTQNHTGISASTQKAGSTPASTNKPNKTPVMTQKTSNSVKTTQKSTSTKLTKTTASLNSNKTTSFVPTAQPSTQSPTPKSSTQSPSTEKPAMKSPSTEKPPTKSPSTEKLTTKSPSTEKPVTQSPSTKSPSTEKPPTKSPSTEPATKSPSTEPATKSPSTEKPPTKSPSTEKPATKSPSTEPPTKSPLTEPATKSPSTEKPATKSPSTEPPTKSPSTEPATKSPSTEPATKSPSTEPATKSPSTEPATKSPSTEKPPTKSTLTEKPSTTLPSTEKSKTQSSSTNKTPQPTSVSPIRHEFVYINEIMLDKTGGFQKVELLLSKKLNVTKYMLVMVDGQTYQTMKRVSLKDMVVEKNGLLLVMTFDASKTLPSMKGKGIGVAIYDTSITTMKADWTVSKTGLVDALVIGKAYDSVSTQLINILTPGVNPFILDPNKYGMKKTISRCSSDQLRSTDMYALINPSFGVDNKQKCEDRLLASSEFAIKIKDINCKLLEDTDKPVPEHQITVKKLIQYLVKKINTECQCGVTRMHIIEPHVHCCDGASVDMKFVAPNKDQLLELQHSYMSFLSTATHVIVQNQLYSVDNNCSKNCCNVPKQPRKPHPLTVDDTAKNVKVTVAVIVSCLIVFMIIVLVVIMYMRRKKSAVYQFRMSRLDEEDEFEVDTPEHEDFVGGQEATFDINSRYQ